MLKSWTQVAIAVAIALIIAIPGSILVYKSMEKGPPKEYVPEEYVYDPKEMTEKELTNLYVNLLYEWPDDVVKTLEIYAKSKYATGDTNDYYKFHIKDDSRGYPAIYGYIWDSQAETVKDLTPKRLQDYGDRWEMEGGYVVTKITFSK